MEAMACADELVPGLPNETALQCLARLPLDAVARCRVVSRSWAAALRHYPSALLFPSRPPLVLACFCTAYVDDQRRSSWSWLFLSPSQLRSHLVPFYNLQPSPALRTRLHAYSSQTQVMATGTNLLLVRSRLRLTRNHDLVLPRNSGKDCKEGGAACFEVEDGRSAAYEGPGALQGFDLWKMKWCRDMDGTEAVPRMHVDRWGFATGHLGKFVYVAGGEGPGAARSAERLDMETGVWEVLPEMNVERGVNPAGFVMGRRFYVAGGEFQPTTSTEGRGIVQTGEYFDTEQGKWKLMEGMWPEELWGCGESEPKVVVVQDMAYALSAASTNIMVMGFDGHWQVRGQLPDPPGFEPLERWYLHIFSVHDDELWVVVSGKASRQPWLVFVCKPHLETDDGLLHWEQRPFRVPPSTWHGILSSFEILV